MTASERLRELREGPYNTALTHSVGTLTAAEHQAGVDAIAKVFGVLPLIADVVEAAEAFVLPKPERGCHCATCALARALTALRDALEKK